MFTRSYRFERSETNDAQNWMTKKNVTTYNVATKCDEGTPLAENEKVQNRSLATTRPFRTNFLEGVKGFSIRARHKTLFTDYHLPVFQKLRWSNTFNQVKSCTKHGRPNQP